MGHDFRSKNPNPSEAETGAGQHGVATAAACALLDLECVPWRETIDQLKPNNNPQEQSRDVFFKMTFDWGHRNT